MKWLLIGLIAATGILNTVQTGSNTTLNKSLGSPTWSVVAVFTAGLITSVIVAVLSGQRFPSGTTLQAAPWWAWIGGVMGVSYVLTMMFAAERVGAAVFMGTAVTLAVITSIVMDHFGWMGFEVHRAGIGRILGGSLMVAGLALIAKF